MNISDVSPLPIDGRRASIHGRRHDVILRLVVVPSGEIQAEEQRNEDVKFIL